MTVRGLLAEMTSADITEQLAYDTLLAEEAKGGREPTPDEVTAKMLAWRTSRRRGGR